MTHSMQPLASSYITCSLSPFPESLQATTSQLPWGSCSCPFIASGCLRWSHWLPESRRRLLWATERPPCHPYALLRPPAGARRDPPPWPVSKTRGGEDFVARITQKPWKRCLLQTSCDCHMEAMQVVLWLWIVVVCTMAPAPPVAEFVEGNFDHPDSPFGRLSYDDYPI